MKQTRLWFLTRWCLLLIGLAVVHGNLLAQTESGVVEGVIRVKFKDTMSEGLKSMKMRKNAKGLIQTGLSAFDNLNTQFAVANMQRVFRDGGKFEAKHQRNGLHLWYEINYTSQSELNAVLKAYGKLSYVQIAEPRHKVRKIGEALNEDNANSVLLEVNDPNFGSQWHYENTGQTGGTVDSDIDLTAAWDESTGSMDVIVSVHDGGIDATHEDIAGNEWINSGEIPNNGIDDDSNGFIDDYNGYNFGDGGGPIPADDHGTHVGGTIAAQNNNGIGVAGVAGGTGSSDGVRLMSLSVFGQTGNNGFAESYVYAADNGAVISQNSWGYTSPGVVDQAVLDGIDYFIANAGYDENDVAYGPMQGGIVIFAAGNDNDDDEYYPGYYDPIFTVSAINHEDEKSWYSNYGTWVDIAAPGGETNSVAQEGVLSTTPGNSYSFFQGTSMACPHVSGVAALIVSKYAGSITPDQIIGRIQSTSDFIDDLPGNAPYVGRLGVGRMNAAAALMDDEGIAPDAIADLTAGDATQNKITISWTAPADTDNGSASVYDIRYSTSAIDDANFADAMSAGSKGAGEAGSAESMLIEGLSSSTEYYFAIKSSDIFGNVSMISNVASTSTTVGPDLSVDPLSISTSLDVSEGTSLTEYITLTNSGAGELNYSATVAGQSSVSATSAILNNLDRSKYGRNNTKQYPLESGGIKSIGRTALAPGLHVAASDSLYYEDGEVEDDFVGFGSGAAFATGTKFTVTQASFTLTHIKNLYRTLTLANPNIILEIYTGGTDPTNGTLHHAQVVTEASSEGAFITTELESPLSLSQGDVFWVVYKFPDGIAFPQGVKEDVSGVENIFYYSGDEGASWSTVESALPNTAYKTRALMAGAGNAPFITIDPTSGTVASGDSQVLDVTFDATNLKNGLNQTSITLVSNDPNNEVINIPVEILISGQQPEIAVSSNFIEFGSAFVGAEAKRKIMISNTGLSDLSISAMEFSNAAFSSELNAIDIAAGDSASVTLTFAPTAVANESGYLTIYSNDEDMSEIKVILAGSGTEPPVIEISPDLLSATLNAGETGSDTLTISNTGTYPLTYSFPEVAVNQLLNQSGIELNNTTSVAVNALTSKDAPDTRVGHPVQLGAGVDQDFGYKWMDSDEAGGPVHYWSDITGDGTEILMGGDANTLVALPFAFNFYGETYNNVYVAANGFLTFEPITASFGGFSNGQIPESSNPNALIAGFWDDIEPQNGSIHYKATGNKFTVQYTGAPHYNGSESGTVTFQIVLYADGSVEMKYDDVEGASFTNLCTVGIENSGGTDGAQVVFNNSYLKDDLTIRFMAPQPEFISSVSPLEGIILPGGSQKIAVGLDATELNDGVYSNELLVSSNDPVNSPAKANIELTVIGTPAIAVDPMVLDFDTVFVGLDKTLTINIDNPGTKTLEISNITNSDASISFAAALPMSVLPGGSAALEVQFAPTAEGEVTDEIVITNSTGTDAIVAVSAVGVNPPEIGVNPNALSMTLDAGTMGYDTLTISNTGGYPLRYSMSATQWLQPSVAQNNMEGARVLTSKEELDDRKGNPVQFGAGMDNSYGYTWEDNQDGDGGAVYNWTDISATGVSAPVGGDGVVTYNLPFSFNFYGTEYTSLYLGANGLLSFEPITASFGAFSNQSIPNTGNPNAVIAPFWDDIEPGSGNGLFVLAEADKVTFQYDQVPHYSSSNTGLVTFQVILYANGGIKYQYKDVDDASFKTACTVGIENTDGTDGINVVFNSEYLKNGMAISFTPPVSNTVAPGTSQKVAVKFDASNLYDGTYQHTVKINSNDPITPLTEVPATLTVIGVPNIESTDSVSFGATYLDPAYAVSEDLVIHNTGSKALEISQIFVAWVGGIDFFPEMVTPLSIAPGTSFDLSILFSPTELGSRNGILVIQSNDPDTPNHFVSLSGTGVNPAIMEVTPMDAISVDLTRYGTSEHTFMVSNAGEADLIYDVSTTDVMGYATPDAGTLVSGGSEEVMLTIDAGATTSGDHQFEVVFNSNDVENPEKTVMVNAHVNYLPTVTLTSSTPEGLEVDENDMLTAIFTMDDMDGYVEEALLLESVDNVDFYYSSSNYTATFKFSPDYAQAGYYTFNILATDDMGDAITYTFNVTVNNVNRMPELVADIEDHAFTTMEETATIDLGDHFMDPDGVELDYMVNVYDNTVTDYSLDGHMLTITSLGYGNTMVEVKAIDPDDTDAYVSSTFAVTVNPINQPPVMTGDMPDLELTTDSEPMVYHLPDMFMDPDGDALQITANGWDDDAIDISIQGDDLVIAPISSGNGQVVVNVNDGNGGNLAVYFMVNIVEQNSSSMALGNYPNPFIESTNISFELKEAQDVRLEVYNSRGDLVSVLIDGQVSEGRNLVSFNALGLERGIYVYKIITREGTATNRMVIQK